MPARGLTEASKNQGEQGMSPHERGFPMTIGQRPLRVAMLTAILFSAQASWGQDAGSWDGAWNGTLGKNHPWPISVSIAKGKVVVFTEKGASFDVRFAKITPTSVVFGDEANYTVTLTKTGDTTASAKVRGRRGSGTALLTKG
jgi:hypothetical protein